MSGKVGDNVFRASGVIAAAAAGRTGTVDWCTTAKTTAVSAADGKGYFVNTCAGTLVVTLPAGTAGAIVGIKDYAFTAGTNNIQIKASGTDKIRGVATATAKLNTDGESAMYVYVDATQGWLPVTTGSGVDPTSNPCYIGATGGCISTFGDYKIHEFTGDGCFTIATAGSAPPCGSNTYDYSVIAGGGGGAIGTSGGSGGGGAGGYRCNSCVSASVSTIPVSVGGGGAAKTGPSANGVTGSNSVFSTITSAGGGGGGGQGPAGNPAGQAGGSGGGAAYYGGAGGAGNTPCVSPPQGEPGGNMNPNGGGCNGGAGGGKGGAGQAGGPSYPGPTAIQPGGVGIDASPLYGTGVGSSGAFSGGGAAGGYDSPQACSDGAIGGGGAGHGYAACGTAGSGEDNTGGGGGGAAAKLGPATLTSGAGGSGAVIIRYKFQN